MSDFQFWSVGNSASSPRCIIEKREGSRTEETFFNMAAGKLGLCINGQVREEPSPEYVQEFTQLVRQLLKEYPWRADLYLKPYRYFDIEFGADGAPIRIKQKERNLVFPGRQTEPSDFQIAWTEHGLKPSGNCGTNPIRYEMQELVVLLTIMVNAYFYT